jgi:CheY-like chemotaxis protein
MLDKSRKIRLLIAEDIDDNFLLISALLKNDNFELIRAKDGAQVVEIARQKDCDIIFMDLKMPVYSGIEATKMIRMFDKNVPIIAVTAFDYGQIRDEALEIGCNDFLYKPYNINVLRAVINKFS